MKSFSMDNPGGITAPKQGDCGYDLRASHDARVSAMMVTKVRTGIHLAIPEGYFGMIAERSSMGAKGIAVRGGIIDSSYRGELVVMLHNLTNEVYCVEKGDKIAQIIFIPYDRPVLEYVDSLEELGETERGQDGFGSTGK